MNIYDSGHCRKRSKNKFQSQQIAAKFKSRQRIKRRKSRNYKKQKHRKNARVRQSNKTSIAADYAEYCDFQSNITYILKKYSCRNLDGDTYKFYQRYHHRKHYYRQRRFSIKRVVWRPKYSIDYKYVSFVHNNTSIKMMVNDWMNQSDENYYQHISDVAYPQIPYNYNHNTVWEMDIDDYNYNCNESKYIECQAQMIIECIQESDYNYVFYDYKNLPLDGINKNDIDIDIDYDEECMKNEKIHLMLSSNNNNINNCNQTINVEYIIAGPKQPERHWPWYDSQKQLTAVQRPRICIGETMPLKQFFVDLVAQYVGVNYAYAQNNEHGLKIEMYDYFDDARIFEIKDVLKAICDSFQSYNYSYSVSNSNCKIKYNLGAVFGPIILEYIFSKNDIKNENKRNKYWIQLNGQCTMLETKWNQIYDSYDGQTGKHIVSKIAPTAWLHYFFTSKDINNPNSLKWLTIGRDIDSNTQRSNTYTRCYRRYPDLIEYMSHDYYRYYQKYHPSKLKTLKMYSNWEDTIVVQLLHQKC